MQKNNRNRNLPLFDFADLGNVLDQIDSRPRRKTNERSGFAPEYLAGQTDRDMAINAMIEIRALWDYVTREAYLNYSNMYSKLSVPISEAVEQECIKHKEHFAVYYKKMKKWLIKSNESEYEYCYDGDDFVEFKDAKQSYQSYGKGNDLLLVGRYTTLMQEPNLLHRTRAAPDLFGTFVLPTRKLIVGVPGCGKTTYIINTHSEVESLVLTSCAEGAEDIRGRMAEKSYSTSDSFRESYRTIDSYLLHQGRPRRIGSFSNVCRTRYDTVWVDEALMEHPGKLFLVCLFTRCRTMYMLGDPNQLGYINRVHGIELIYDKPSRYFTTTKTLNVSYRCPVDVMAVLSSKYDGGAFSTSKVNHSMESKRFTTLERVRKSGKVKYLVFKQAEKQQMKKAGYNVSTIHEFQGKEADDVVIVRMSRNPHEELYKSVPHLVVGISRHKRSLVYYTPIEDDMKRLIETPLTLTDLKKIKKICLTRKPL